MVSSISTVFIALLPFISASSYKLNNTYQGNNFFDQFNFFTHTDYSHGYVQYMNESYCVQNGLINSTADQVYIGVDHTKKLIVGDEGRPSVRIESKVFYNSGLFIADIEHMPQGINIPYSLKVHHISKQ